MNHKPRRSLLADFLEPPNPVRHRWTRRRRELHLDRNQSATGFDNQINLSSRRRAPEVELRLLAAVDKRLDDLQKDGGFEDCPAHYLQVCIPNAYLQA